MGLTNLDPGIILSKGTKQFLNDIGDLVLKENMGVYNELTTKKSFNGKASGVSLDRELLYNEQTKIQYFMNSLGPSQLEKYIDEYNSGFKLFQVLKSKDHYLNVASSIIGGDIDFRRLRHRLIIGQILMHQMHGKEIDEKAKAQIKEEALEDTKRFVNE